MSLELKANGGTLGIDDFGRQRMRIDDLLNRWIVPLESGHDYYSLNSGRRIRMPFQQVVAFATNLEPRDLVDERLVRWYFFAALTFMLVSMLGGILVALQLVHWNPLHGLEIFSPGRWRMVHPNAIAYGSGCVPLGAMIRAGFGLNLLGILVVVGYVWFIAF